MGTLNKRISLLALGLCCFAGGATVYAQSPPAKAAVSDGAFPSDPATAAKISKELAAAATHPTPHLGGGHVDLTGYWGPVVGMFGFDGKPFIDEKSGSARPLFGDNGQESRNADSYYSGRANYDKNAASRPVYKPEFRDRAKANFMHVEMLDPLYKCQAVGVPRLGPPNEIFQSAKAVVFLYENPFDNPDHFTYRVIPTDGRAHDPNADSMPMGDSVAHWQDGTLIIDVSKLSSDTWVDRNGSFHDENLHVVERLTRKGDTLTYEVTMDDPTLFEQPYSPKPTTWILKPGEHSHEDYPCIERDQAHVTYEEGK